MFNFRRKKVARKEVDNYVIELSDEKVVISTKAKRWKVEYYSNTAPYAMFSAMWDDNEILETMCLYLHANLSLISDAKYVGSVLKTAMKTANAVQQAAKVSKAEDDEILRETQALMEQTEEAVDKHIAAQKKHSKRRRNDRAGNQNSRQPDRSGRHI